MAHGGHCVARHQGRVVFVRHAIPGETVRAAVTQGGASAKFWRADAVSVIERSEHRRTHPWPAADAHTAHASGALPVGGAELGHISLAHQRRLKAHVFRDQLARIGDLTLDRTLLGGFDRDHLTAEGEPRVTALDGSSDGLHWRTRADFAVTPEGQLGMHPHREHEVIPISDMPLAVEALTESPVFGWDFSGAEHVDLIAPGARGPLTVIVRTRGEVSSLEERLVDAAGSSPGEFNLVLARIRPSEPRRSPRRESSRRRQNSGLRLVHETLLGRHTVDEPLPHPVAAPDGPRTHVTLRAESFWQIHRRAPQALISAVDRMADIGPGESVADLYAGAGLFTAWAAERVGPTGHVLSVEAAEASSASAKDLFQGLNHVEVLKAPVERILSRLRSSDLVLLDPPRAGAGERAIAGIDAAAPRQIIYVSCDPASFARDAKALAVRGWRLRDLEVIDMYPNTHHMESVAVFAR